MTGFQKILQALSEQGDERADALLVKSLDYDEKTLPMFVAENDDELNSVLDIENLTSMVNEDPGSDASKKMMEALKEYTDLRNQGRNMFAPNSSEKMDIYGKKVPTVDDFMKEFGAIMGETESEDDARAAFTNPENSRYWGNYPQRDRNLAAMKMGYKDAREMEQDLDRTARGYQTQNQVEGWGPNNEFQPVSWAVSSLKGLATPRIKEAQAAGRGVTWQDVLGDMGELGLNFIPGVGIVGKGGKVFARIGPKAELVGKALGMGLESVAVPGLTQAMDAGFLYNPDMLGDETSGLNHRSEFSLPAMAAQAGGIAGAKGAIKGGAGMVKNAMETSMGEQSGKKGFKQAFEYVENIGESTDDLIARRQAMLDRKAELAKQHANVKGKMDTRVTSSQIENGGYADPSAIFDAQNFQILSDEARQFGKTQPLRKDYEAAMKEFDETSNRIKKKYDPQLRELINQYGMETARKMPEYQAIVDRMRNETFASREAARARLDDASKKYNAAVRPGREILMLDDGRFVYNEGGIKGGYQLPNKQYLADFAPGNANYAMIPPKNIKNLTEPGEKFDGSTLYQFQDPVAFPKMGAGRNRHIEATMTPSQYAKRGNKGTGSLTQMVTETPREPATLAAIQNDPLLSRKLDRFNTPKEVARDVMGNAAFNALAREGIVGNIDSMNEKRDRALWNRQLMKMRPFVLDKSISLDERKRRQDAVMNVMTYGLEGLPEELYRKEPGFYRAIAGQLGVNGWKHWSERGARPTTSMSTGY